jgi:hypothetical protein
MDEDAEGPASEEQTFPSELRGSLPRRVQVNSANASAVIVVAVLCLGVGGVLTGAACRGVVAQIRARTALRQEGRDTVATVTATHAGHGSPTVTYAFKVHGLSYWGKAEISNYGLVFHKSDQIAVRYLQTDPTVNHPADWEWSGVETMDLIPEVFLLFLTSVGVVALVALFRDRKLARRGIPAKGVVTDCSPGKSDFRVEYEFRTVDGVPASGHSSSPDEYGAGARIWILYLSKNPQRNSMYPLRYFEVVE